MKSSARQIALHDEGQTKERHPRAWHQFSTEGTQARTQSRGKKLHH
jgi:hypothetical protein